MSFRDNPILIATCVSRIKSEFFSPRRLISNPIFAFERLPNGSPNPKDMPVSVKGMLFTSTPI